VPTIMTRPLVSILMRLS